MKHIRVILSYFRGIRFQTLLLAVMMTFSLLVSIQAMGKYEYLRVGYDIFNSDRKDDIYYVYRFFSRGEKDMNTALSNQTKSKINELKEMDGVESVYTVWHTNIVHYIPPETWDDVPSEEEDFAYTTESRSMTSIIFLEPEMLEDFPALKKIGFKWRDENGCLLANSDMKHYIEDGELTLYSSSKLDATFSYQVEGWRQFPYYRFSLSHGSTEGASASDFLVTGEKSVFLLYTEENLDKLKYTSCSPDLNLMLKFKEDATQEERDAVLEDLSDLYHTQSVTDILEKTQKEIQDQIWMMLAKPIFMLLVSTVAFFSTVILTVKSKEKEVAIYYLCGASKVRCGVMAFATFAFISIVPTFIGYLYVWIRPILESKEIIYVQPSMLMGAYTKTFVILYFIFTLLIAAGTVFVSMAGKNPIQFLRGAEK